MQPGTIYISSIQAPCMDFLAGDLAHYLSSRLSIPVEARLDVPWQERFRLFQEGEVHLCWVCGLPYVRLAERFPGRFSPLAAPVMQAPRYQGRPVYFSDMVVRRDSPFHTFDDLRGAVWTYNEPGSQSGYGIVLYSLAQRGKNLNFFGRIVESGAHQASLQMIVRGEVDASAIDSTVLEQVLADEPQLAEQIRVIATLGPSPIPPWVVHQEAGLPDDVILAMRRLLVNMHAPPEGRDILSRARLRRFSPVSERDYDPIRAMIPMMEMSEIADTDERGKRSGRRLK